MSISVGFALVGLRNLNITESLIMLVLITEVLGEKFLVTAVKLCYCVSSL